MPHLRQRPCAPATSCLSHQNLADPRTGPAPAREFKLRGLCAQQPAPAAAPLTADRQTARPLADQGPTAPLPPRTSDPSCTRTVRPPCPAAANIVEVASSKPQLSTLVAAVQAAGLVEELSDPEVRWCCVPVCSCAWSCVVGGWGQARAAVGHRHAAAVLQQAASACACPVLPPKTPLLPRSLAGARYCVCAHQ